MKTPEWVQPGLYGAAAGAIALAIVGFTWGGWVTGGTAEAKSRSDSKAAVLAALTPVCLEQARLDPEADAKLALLKEAKGNKRRDLVMEVGWATLPGAEAPDRDLADACQKVSVVRVFETARGVN